MTRAILKLALLTASCGLLVACTVDSNEPIDGPGSGGGGAAGSPAAGSGGAASGSGGGPSGGAGASAGGATGGGGVGGAQAGGGSGGSAGGGAGGSGGAVGGGGSAGGGGMAGMGGMLPFALTSPVLEHVETCTDAAQTTCKIFPSAHLMTSLGGMNQSPELNWSAGPAGTMSYVVSLHDTSNTMTHWVIWNIPASTLKLSANLARTAMPAMPSGASQKSFSGSDAGYMGPGAKKHVYEFEVYALKNATFTPKMPTEGEIYKELQADTAKIVLGSSILRARSPD